jgi:hypothetical protein
MGVGAGTIDEGTLPAYVDGRHKCRADQSEGRDSER